MDETETCPCCASRAIAPGTLLYTKPRQWMHCDDCAHTWTVAWSPDAPPRLRPALLAPWNRAFADAAWMKGATDGD